MAKIHIGTSGWTYAHWEHIFYPDGLPKTKYFEFYRQHFQTVELNSSFYHLPLKKTFSNWHTAVEKNFLFSVKASRYITHIKKLSDAKESIALFLENAQELKENLGPILFQLPPGWEVNPQRLQAFLELLPANFRYTFEFRNATWYTEEIYVLLAEKNCAFCIYELGKHQSPLKVTADFVYVRLHGPGAKYQGRYSDQQLQKWADHCAQWLTEGKDVFVYFDNDQAAYAVFNAMTLADMLDVSKK